MSYKKYDSYVKELVIQTENPNLFPELNIPRTTALYWIRKSKKEIRISKNSSDSELLKYYKKELYRQKAYVHFLKKFVFTIFEDENFLALKAAEKRKAIVEAIEEMSGLIPKIELLKIIKLTPSSYHRWKSEALSCQNSRKRCDVTRPNQLSKEEQLTMLQLANDPKYKQLSIKSLMYLAQRQGILYCGIDSWYKYLKLNGVKRKIGNQKEKKYKKGIRAKHPHQIWHIDITEFICIERKIYLQLIIDNYSRAIIGWKFSITKELNLTIESLSKAFYLSNVAPEFLYSDAGGENKNYPVIKLLLGKGVTQIIAQSDVIFSNSMIEAVFRQIKQKATRHRNLKQSSLEIIVKRFIYNYNNKFPHSSLGGATPREALQNSFCKSAFHQFVSNKRTLKTKERSKRFQSCLRCYNRTCKNHSP